MPTKMAFFAIFKMIFLKEFFFSPTDFFLSIVYPDGALEMGNVSEKVDL